MKVSRIYTRFQTLVFSRFPPPVFTLDKSTSIKKLCKDSYRSVLPLTELPFSLK